VHGLAILRELAGSIQGRPLNLLTHCNAGWLATVDWGTALAPSTWLTTPASISTSGSTRPPRSQARPSRRSSSAPRVPHTVVVDSAGGHLMQRGLVDACIVGSDRTTRTGDVANKIGTYLKALAAHASGIRSMWRAHPTIDWTIRDGLREIPIEQRDPREVSRIAGRAADGRWSRWRCWRRAARLPTSPSTSPRHATSRP